MKLKENRKGSEIQLRNEILNVEMNIEKIRDLSILLGEYFNEDNFEPIEKMKKEGQKREELLASEVAIFRRYFEEYKTLLFEIIDKLEKTRNDCESILKNYERNDKE